MSEEVETRRLVVCIVDFLRSQLHSRFDLTLEDRDSLGIAAECLELAYGLENDDPRQRRVIRPLTEIFSQVVNPPSIKNKIRAETYKNEANEKMTQHLYDDALELYTRAIELDKWNAIYYCNRAGANLELRRFNEAIADCRKALSLNADYSKAFARMGQTYVLMERPGLAARCYQQALILEPDNERYRNNLQAAESQAAANPQGDILQQILASLFGGGREGNEGFATGATLTIITEVTPLNEGSIHDADENNNQTTAEGNQQELSSPFENESTNQQDSMQPNILSMLFGMMARQHQDHDHDHDHSMEQNQSSGNSVVNEEQATDFSGVNASTDVATTRVENNFNNQSDTIRSTSAQNIHTENNNSKNKEQTDSQKGVQGNSNEDTAKSENSQTINSNNTENTDNATKNNNHRN